MDRVKWIAYDSNTNNNSDRYPGSRTEEKETGENRSCESQREGGKCRWKPLKAIFNNRSRHRF